MARDRERLLVLAAVALTTTAVAIAGASGGVGASQAAETPECVDRAASLIANRVDAADEGAYGAETFAGFVESKAEHVDSPDADMQVDLLADYIDENYDVSPAARDETAALLGTHIDGADKADSCWLDAPTLSDEVSEHSEAIDDPGIDVSTGDAEDMLSGDPVVPGGDVPTPTPTEPGDADDDTVGDDLDECPDEPEDADGVEDGDGCPEDDADYDGIPDSSDGCPTKSEDMDGYTDADGCPDVSSESDTDREFVGGPGFGVGTAFLALVAFLIVAARRRD